MLQKGHHGVQLDRKAWDRLTTWIDLNATCHGTWQETVGVERTEHRRGQRIDLLKAYANIEGDPEAIPSSSPEPVRPVLSDRAPRRPHAGSIWATA